MTLISQPYSLSLFLMLIKRGLENGQAKWVAGLRKTAREIGAACKEIEPLSPGVGPMQEFDSLL